MRPSRPFLMRRSLAESESRPVRAARSPRARFGSPLARQLFSFNLLALVIPVCGILYLSDFAQSLVELELRSSRTTAELFSYHVAFAPPNELRSSSSDRITAALRRSSLLDTHLHLFHEDGTMLAYSDTATDLADAARARDAASARDAGNFGLVPRLRRVFFNFLLRDPSTVEILTPSDKVAPLPLRYLEDALQGFSPSQMHRADGKLISIASVALHDASGNSAVLAVIHEASDIEAKIATELRRVFWIWAFGLGLVSLLTLLMYWSFVRPLRHFTLASARIGDSTQGQIESGQYAHATRDDEIGELSRALEQMTSALKTRVESAEQFTADLAHEVKNPLASLRSATDLLVESQDPQQRRQLRTLVQDDVARLNALVEGIMASSRLEAEMLQLRREILSLRDLVSSVVEIMRTGEAVAAHVRITADLPAEEEICAFRGVGNRIAEALRNLILNASSFSPEDGEVVVSLSRKPPPDANPPTELAAFVRSEGYWIAVEDSGSGITPGSERKIFRRFYSEARARGVSEVQGGERHFGLGLNSAARVVAAHGGCIWGQNRPAGGAGFYVFLPRRPAES